MDESRKYLELKCDICSTRYVQQERVYRIAKWENRCARHRRRITQCKDCGIEICKDSLRCKKCYGLSKRFPENHCIICGKKIQLVSKVCLSCHNRSQFKNRTSERIRFNTSKKWADLRSLCFERDNYTCTICGDHNYKERGKTIYLEGHHIKSWKDHKELRLDKDNITTLCYDCHKRVHRKKKEYAQIQQDK